jgi:hypothetical protein
VSQAVTAIEQAWQAGVRRQRLELLLPLIGATDLDDWPGGVRQQFKAAAPLVEGGGGRGMRSCGDLATQVTHRRNQANTLLFCSCYRHSQAAEAEGGLAGCTGCGDLGPR